MRKVVPTDLPLGQLLLGFWVPGYSFRLDGTVLPAWLILGGWCLGLFTFLLLMTAPPMRFLAFQLEPAYLAFGLMIALHATSANYLVMRVWQLVEFARRVLAAVLVTAFLIFIVYFPAWGLVQRNLFKPVEAGGTRIVVNPRASAATIQRGDLVLYWIQYSYAGGVIMNQGYELQPVLGLPGDRIRFGGRVFWVNDERHPIRPEMPADGELMVPDKHWFIWPELQTGGHGGDLAAQRQAAYLKLALVAHGNLAGRAYQRWFFWKQTLP